MPATTPMTATSPMMTSFNLTSQEVISFVGLVAQANANSAALVALTPAVVSTAAVEQIVSQDYFRLKTMAAVNMGSQMWNGLGASNEMNLTVTVTVNLANIATTPITYTIAAGATAPDYLMLQDRVM